MRLRLCAVAVAAVLMVAGCGDDDNSGSGSSASTQTTANTTTPRGVEMPFYTNRLAKPRGPGPHPGARVEQLIIRDVREGIGPEIHAGDVGIFDFISTDWVTGREIDGSWRRRRPFETRIERNVVIDGWWQGIPGMRVGGRRTIVIPPSLGFTTNAPDELLGATTYFDIVLLAVRPELPTGPAAEPPATRENPDIIQR